MEALRSTETSRASTDNENVDVTEKHKTLALFFTFIQRIQDGDDIMCVMHHEAGGHLIVLVS